MSGWTDAVVTRNELVGPELHRVTMQVPPEVASAFHKPGQYHRVRAGEAGDAPYAMASAPGEPFFEYLVRRGMGVSAEWTGVKPGGAVQVSLPEGPGFPVERARGVPLLLIATGTGWAPMRSVLRSIVKNRGAFGPVRALYGAHSPAHFGFSEDFPALRAAGVELVQVVGVPDAAWAGPVGRVQQHLGAAPGAGALAFVAGHPEMIAEVTALLGGLGVSGERVFQNA